MSLSSFQQVYIIQKCQRHKAQIVKGIFDAGILIKHVFVEFWTLNSRPNLVFGLYNILFSECSTDTLNLSMLFIDNMADVISYSLQIKEI